MLSRTTFILSNSVEETAEYLARMELCPKKHLHLVNVYNIYGCYRGHLVILPGATLRRDYRDIINTANIHMFNFIRIKEDQDVGEPAINN